MCAIPGANEPSVGSAVLDVPCGGPALRGPRKDQQVRYVAADLAGHARPGRARASAMGRDGVEFVEADIERMPFDDNEFDIDWLASAGLRINFLRQSGALVHFGAVRD